MSNASQSTGSPRSALSMRGVAMLAVGMAAAAPVNAATWRLDILTADTLSEHTVEGAFQVLPGGGPDGAAVIEFADPDRTSGSIAIDLSDVDLTRYDQLHFDLWLEHDYVDTTVTLRGYPDAFRGRRWYAFKRFQPFEAWTDIRLDLALDDDLSHAVFDEARKDLVMVFRRPDTASPNFGRARIRNVRLVRSPITISVDYRDAITATGDDGLRFTYPVQLENRTDRSLDVRLEVLPETLRRFTASLARDVITLPAGEQALTTVELAIGPDVVELPTGYVERAQILASVAELPGFTAVPIRGYRPVYLFAMVPPESARDVIFQRIKAEADNLNGDIARYASSLEWAIEKPPADVTPAHPARFRCPECNSTLDMDNLYTYFCYSRDISGQCENHLVRITIDKTHPLFPPLLHSYHAKNARIARSLALGWLRTGDQHLADKAMRILADYQSMYRDLLPVAPHSAAFQSRFCSASLFERHFLEHMIEVWLILSETAAADAGRLRTMAEGFLADSLRITNLHYYSFSASQIDMVTQVLKASAILNRWAYAADALAGDGGVLRILDRNFNADGVPIDGGDYARQAARQIMTLAAAMQGMDIEVEATRLDAIRRHSQLLGYLPRPEGFKLQTTVLENTGFTILANGEGATRRRVTINWGSTRERGGHDQLTTVLYDAEERELLMRTRRVMWGHPHAMIAFQSFAQNIPVVDERNISTSRLNQVYLRDDARAAGVIISDGAERPAYPDSRLTRSLVLFDGCLLVADRFVSLAGERQVDFPVNGLASLSAYPEGMVPFTDELGQTQIYRLPHDLRTKVVENQPFTAEWAQADRGVRMHMLGDGFRAFAGQTYMGQSARSVPRDFLMLRTRGETVAAAFLYEATHADAPRVTGFARVAVEDAVGRTVTDDRAQAYDVAFSDDRVVRVLISFDGAAYRSGDGRTDSETRIAVYEVGR